MQGAFPYSDNSTVGSGSPYQPKQTSGDTPGYFLAIYLSKDGHYWLAQYRDSPQTLSLHLPIDHSIDITSQSQDLLGLCLCFSHAHSDCLIQIHGWTPGLD